VYRLAGDALELVQALANDDMLESPLLPGFQLSIDRIWPPTL
jgi:Uma2 family endonuclease